MVQTKVGVQANLPKEIPFWNECPRDSKTEKSHIPYDVVLEVTWKSHSLTSAEFSVLPGGFRLLWSFKGFVGLLENHHSTELSNDVSPRVWGFGRQGTASGESPMTGRITTSKDARRFFIFT